MGAQAHGAGGRGALGGEAGPYESMRPRALLVRNHHLSPRAAPLPKTTTYEHINGTLMSDTHSFVQHWLRSHTPGPRMLPPPPCSHLALRAVGQMYACRHPTSRT